MAMGAVAWKIMGTGGAILAGVVATKVIDAIWAKAEGDEINPKSPQRTAGQGRRLRHDHRPRGRRRQDPRDPQGGASSTRSRPGTCPARSPTNPSDARPSRGAERQ